MYLIGMKFTIRKFIFVQRFFGHRFVNRSQFIFGLKFLESKLDVSGRIGRWFVRLWEFKYKTEYLKDHSNGVADALNRNPVESSTHTVLIDIGD